MPEFEWDIHNIEHIAKHQMLPSDVEEAFSNFVSLCEITDDSQEFRRCMIGELASGKKIKNIFTYHNEKIRIVTAYPTR